MYLDIYKGKKVLVTGDTGFKGSWLVTWLNLLGAEVYGIAKDLPSNPSMFEILNLSSRISHNEMDIRNLQAVNAFIQTLKPDFVFHLAAQTLVGPSYQDPIDTFSSNVMGACHVAEALRESNHFCVALFISSDKAYKNVEWTWGYRENDALGGKDPYSASKGAMEILIRSYFYSFFNSEHSNVRMGTARAGNVIGGGDWATARIIPDCMRAWSQGEPVVIRSPKYGLVASLLGDGEDFHFKRARREDAAINYVIPQVLNALSVPHRVIDFIPYGYDERQYCSPGINLPMGCLTRSTYGTFPEYHTSADNLDFVKAEHLQESLGVYREIMYTLDNNLTYMNLNPKCEPQLGRRGLYDLIGGKNDGKKFQLAMLWVLNYSDGTHSLLDISNKSKIDFHLLVEAAKSLVEHQLLAPINYGKK